MTIDVYKRQTHELMKLRADYLKTKKNLGKRAGIDEVKSLAATNAKLTAMMLRRCV